MKTRQVNHLGMDAVRSLDDRLSRLSRAGGSLRLALGRGLDALARQGGHHELGFSSIEAYALERCERCARWVQESRALARRLEGLPRIRAALAAGRLSWSAAGVVARIATPDSEEEWLELALGLTVRELDRATRDARLLTAQGEGTAAERGEADAGTALPDSNSVEPEALRTLTVTVDRSDGWLFEAARTVAEHLAGARDADTVIEALVAEGFTTAQAWLPRSDMEALDTEGDPAEEAQRAWETQLRQWREEAEEMCEERWRGAAVGGEGQARATGIADDSMADEPRFEGSPEVIDMELREVARALASRDLVMGRLAETLWKADGWRQLGYATEAQYARERLGQGLSSVKAKRALARRASRLPALAKAVEEGKLGYEAARVVSDVADASTLGEWLEHAEVRTVRHLREEADATRMLAALANRPMTPPDEELMREVEELESRILSGAVFGSRDGANGANDANDANGADEGQMSAVGGQGGAAGAKVTLRLRVRGGTYRVYRRLEGLFVRRFGKRVPFFRFLCLAFLETWKSALGTKGAYAGVYARDRYRCRSPVCTRRDITPHHLVFRARGGDDSGENVVSLCVWCHLHGIHQGRLGAEYPATGARFRVGRSGHTVVWGRRREVSR